jgi:hypothetical protein
MSDRETTELNGDRSYLSDGAQAPAPLARREAPPATLARPLPPAAASASQAITSSEVGEILAALANAQAEYTQVTKRRQADLGPRGRYSYANLGDVAEAVMPALRKHGIYVMQIPTGPLLVTRLSHGPSGQWIEGSIRIVQPQDGRGGIQALGSALTYLRRYTLTAMLGIVPEDDDDGAAAQAAIATAPARRQPAQRSPTLRDIVADLATWEDLTAARAKLISVIEADGYTDDVRAAALDDFDARAGAS